MTFLGLHQRGKIIIIIPVQARSRQIGVFFRISVGFLQDYRFKGITLFWLYRRILQYSQFWDFFFKREKPNVSRLNI